MAIEAFFYDAEGRDRPIVLADIDRQANDHTLLWVDLAEPTDGETASVADTLDVPVESVSPRILTNQTSVKSFGNHLKFIMTLPGDETAMSAADQTSSKNEQLIFVIGNGWLITSHAGKVPLLNEFREKDSTETLIGALSSAALAASLIDWLLGLYFDKATSIANEVDVLDEMVLRDKANRSLLSRIVTLRRKLSRLRGALIANRPVFYGLSRPDCTIIADSDASEHFSLLSGRFERAIDEIERVRDLINGSFDLFASRSSLQTNSLVKALTVISAVLGYFGAVAGLFGMNLKSSIFNGGDGTFAAVIGTLIVTSALALLVARKKKWL